MPVAKVAVGRLIGHDDCMAAHFPPSILIYGCGNMGRAMLDGWIAAGINPACFAVVDPFAKALPAGVLHIESSAAQSASFDVVLLGIKPQMLTELVAEIAPIIRPHAKVISILAGINSQQLGAHFPGRKIIRLMPNLAAAIGKSPMGLWSNDLDVVEKAALENWLAPLGTPVWLSSEAQMDAVTALAGSGPAFVYRFIDALSKGGATLGLEPDVAAKLALAMVEGAATLAAQTQDSPADLARKVTSSGGTTAAGLAVLDDDAALAQLLEATLRAARDRGAALGNADRQANGSQSRD
jgi:pyrroline-5-carboxylate reductase